MLQISKLSNGMRVVTDSSDEVETVAVGVWCKVGARLEKLSGISHLLEHMAFKGTTTRSALKIAEEVENVGGYMNAYTSEERTAYYLRLLKEDLPLGIDILADILQHSTMDPVELKREQQVVLQEIGRTFDSPDDIIFDYYGQTAYPNQDFGRPVLGSKESVSAITSEDLRSYISNEYTADRLVLSVSGHVNHQEVVDLAEKAFCDLKKKADTAWSASEYKGGSFVDTRKIEQENLLVGYEGVSETDDKHIVQEILAQIFGGGMSSRLFQEIREKRGLVYSIFSYAMSYADTGVFGIYAGTGAEKTKELLTVLQDEIDKLPTALTEEEIVRAKNQMKAGFFMKLESLYARCERNAKELLSFGEIEDPHKFIERVNGVTKEDLSALAKQIFSGKATRIGVGPLETLD